MSAVHNDQEFRSTLDALDSRQQRRLGAAFVRSVQQLSDDPRITAVLTTADNLHSEEAQLKSAFLQAKSASLEAHTRCGAEGEWNGQAAYFVARAAEACVEPQVRSHGKGIAWKSAVSARMARTCLAVDSDTDAHDQERQAQYDILNNYLDA